VGDRRDRGSDRRGSLRGVRDDRPPRDRARSPAYHYEPETNGCAEKFIQTLKEQVLWIERFETFEELRAAVRKFAVTYNHQRLLERHSYRTPIQAREHLLIQTLVA
jgi:hypothetical protein